MAEESGKNDLEESEKESAKIGLISKTGGIFKKVFKSKKIIIIVAVTCLLLIGLGAGAWFLFFKSNPEDVSGNFATEQTVEEAAVREQEIVFEDIVELEPFERIPLKSSSTMGLVTINLSLELTDQRYRKQIFSMESRIRDIIKSQIQDMTWLELRNPEGKIMLKYNLLKRINALFPKLTIRNIYFTYFIMQ